MSNSAISKSYYPQDNKREYRDKYKKELLGPKD
jgi:hypothetical protein